MKDSKKRLEHPIINMRRSYRTPKVEVRDTSIEGRGIFATKAIAESEIVCVLAGCVFTREDFLKLGTRLKQYFMQLDDEFFLGPFSEAAIAETSLHINHSCQPNVGFRGEITYVALRDIYPGEELTHDYAMVYTSAEAFPDMQCQCGSEYCRGTVTSDDWMKPELQRKYGNHFVTHVLEKIRTG